MPEKWICMFGFCQGAVDARIFCYRCCFPSAIQTHTHALFFLLQARQDKTKSNIILDLGTRVTQAQGHFLLCPRIYACLPTFITESLPELLLLHKHLLFQISWRINNLVGVNLLEWSLWTIHLAYLKKTKCFFNNQCLAYLLIGEHLALPKALIINSMRFIML